MTTQNLESNIDQDALQEYLNNIYLRADDLCRYFTIGSFIFGVIISPIYDTWIFGMGVGGLNFALFMVGQYLISNKFHQRLITSMTYAIFVLQFIAQLHGMAEGHFTFFIFIAILIIYQDWRILVPYVILTVFHHSFLFFLELQGYGDFGTYFINYTDVNAFVLTFHYIFVVTMGVVCGAWSLILRRGSIRAFIQEHNLLNQVKQNKKAIEFAEEISKGNFGVNFHIDSEEDDLGKSLLKMRESLTEAAEKEKRERFINEGVNQVNQILRTHLDDMETLANEVISVVIHYLKLTQASLFITDEREDTPFLKQIASYAYDRRKYQQREILYGEGLLGQVFLEKEMLYMREVPDDYLYVNSGLGEGKLSCLVIIPLVNNDVAIGVLEVASFYEIDEVSQEFLKKVADSIASTMTSVRTNDQTKKLLQQAQIQAEELRATEEEMSQNMEELQSVQEKIEHKTQTYERVIEEKDAEIHELKRTLSSYKTNDRVVEK